MRKTSSFASVLVLQHAKGRNHIALAPLAPLESERAMWFLGNIFSASPSTTEGKPKTSHLGSEQWKWKTKKRGRNVTSGGCVAPLPMPCPGRHISRKASASNRTEAEHGLNGSWINVLGFASVHYFCCWTPLNLFDLKVTDHLPSWEENSSTCCDLYKNLS